MAISRRSCAIRYTFKAFAAGFFATFASPAANGQTNYSWNVAGNGNWNLAADWTVVSGLGTTFPGAGDTAIFSDAAVAETCFLNGNEAAGSLIFSNTGATTLSGGVSATPAANTLALSGGITVNAGAGAVSIGSATAAVNIQLTGSQSFVNNSSNTLTIANGISSAAGPQTLTLDGSGTGIVVGIISNTVGTTSLVKQGSGSWELDGATNSFSGGTTLAAGTLFLKSSNALGSSGSKTFTITGGTIASIGSARAISSFVSVIIGGNFTIGTSTSGGLTLGFNGPVNLGGATRSIVFNNSSTWAGVVSNGGIIKANSGTNITTLTLTVANTYAGPTTINSGTITAGIAGAFPSGSAFTVASGTTLNLAGFSQTIGSLSDSAGAGGSVTVGNAAAGTLTTGGDGSTTTFSGIISGTGTGGGLTKTGIGTFTLGGANSYGGATTVTAGTLAVSSLAPGLSNSNIGSSSSAATNLVINGGTLQYTGPAVGTDRLFSVGTAAGNAIDASGTGAVNFTNAGAIVFTGNGSRNLTLTGTNTGANTLSPILADGTGGATTLTKAGAGTWVVTAANTYSGATVVNAGTLSVSGASATFGTGNVTVNGAAGASSLQIQTGVSNAIADSATLTLAGGGTLDVADVGFANLGTGINETVTGLVLGSTVETAAGTYGSTASGANFQSDEFFAGTGVVTLVPVPEPAGILPSVVGLFGAASLIALRRNRGNAT